MKKQANENKIDYAEILKNADSQLLYEIFNKEFEALLNCIEDGIFICDGEGTIIGMNEASLAITPLSKEDLLGKNVYDLVEDGTFKEGEVGTIEALKTKEKFVVIQKGILDKYDILATSIPLFQDGKITKVVTTERDVTTILKLESQTQIEREKSQRIEQELEYYRRKDAEVLKEIVAESSVMKETMNLATRVARNDVTVLLQGETGVGKEVIAKLIHQNSKRKDKPFIRINCASIPENLLESELYGYEKGAFTGAGDKAKLGFFELANEGTILLDEIDTIPLHLQSKLLRALQENVIFRVGGTKEIAIDVRIIAATNYTLKEAVFEGNFREDLFYRLNVVPITVAPLRERKADIFPLAERFVRTFNLKYNLEKRLSPSVESSLLGYNWPGNVRELENLMERLVVTCERTVIDNLTLKPFLQENIVQDNKGVSSRQNLKEAVEKFEEKIISENMPNYRNSRELAEALSIDKSTLTRKIRKYKIKSKYWK